jgi:hypothetical protein
MLHSTNIAVSRDELSLGDASPVPGSSGVRNVREELGRLTRLTSGARLTDRQLTVAVSAVLFVVGAWPIALTDVPPYQDLPNHLATLTVMENLKAYPEYVFNGFFKTNAALFAWLYVVGKVTGIKLAARLFALLTIGLTAFVLPRFVLRFGGSRERMLIASLFAWPMVHNWFVSMGMLDFAIALPLSFALLIALDKHRQAPSLKGGLAVAGLGVLTWYAHVFPLLVVNMLLVLESIGQRTWRERFRSFGVMAWPFVPPILLTLVSILNQMRTMAGPMTGFVNFDKLLPPWELAYNLWAEWFWGYSNLSITSIVPCILLGVLGFRAVWRSRESARPIATPAVGPSSAGPPTFFAPRAILVLVLLYAFLPYNMTNWFHVNSRLIPFLWVGLLLYLPKELPKSLVIGLGAAGLLYSAGMGVDYVRLDRERQEFSAGIEAVPEGAKLLPLMFKHKSVSSNTRNLLHMWGYYVVERKTAAPLLFAHSRSFPVTYSEPPPPTRFNHLVLESFAPEMSTPASACFVARRVTDCDALFAETWQRFFADATPRFDHLLVWEGTPEALAMIPKDYERVFERGRVMIYRRRPVLARADANIDSTTDR